MAIFKNQNEIQKYINKQIGNPKFSELFSDKFIQKYTNFKTANDFFDNGNIDMENLENNKELDVYIKTSTKFKDWNDFKNEAIMLYAQSKGIPLTR